MDGQQRVALVTGAASGMGAAVARDFARDHRLCLLDWNEAGLRDTVAMAGAGALARRVDVSDRASVEAALQAVRDTFGRLDVLVHCAGYSRTLTTQAPLAEAEAVFDEVVRVNLKGAWLVSAAAAPLLSRPGGRIVHVSSISAFIGGRKPGSLAYAAAKAGVVGLTYALARELSPQGITANALAPGMVEGTGFVASAGNSDERTRLILSETPAGRGGTVDDIVAAVRYLASPAASFTTGQVLHVNGGWLFH